MTYQGTSAWSISPGAIAEAHRVATAGAVRVLGGPQSLVGGDWNMTFIFPYNILGMSSSQLMSPHIFQSRAGSQA